MVAALDARGWAGFAPEAATQAWAAAARPHLAAALADPALGHWHQCEGTWFVGLDALPNGPQGAVPDGPPLTGVAVSAARRAFGWPALHRAQLSVVYPGYPRPRAGESAAAFRYRRDRDAAHVDGVIGQGTPKRRFVTEPHAFILGIGLTPSPSLAAPLVVWEGSHRIMRRAFRDAFAAAPPDRLGEVDVTEIYQSARRRAFEICARVPVPLAPGGAILLHPMLLHGVAPWQAAPEGHRAVAYFRPPAAGGVPGWLASA